MNVTTKRLDALKHPKKNVRIHSEQQIRELKRSLEKFGQTRAIVVDEDDTILIGNGLYEAMVSLGYQEATVYAVSYTHLDVYKRQVIWNSWKIEACCQDQ